MQTATHPAKPAHRATRQPVLIGFDPGAPDGDHTALALRYNIASMRGRGRVTIALDAFPDMPPVHLPRDTSNADYWAFKAREHITVLRAALELHKQLTSGAQVPRSLCAVLTAGQARLGQHIKTCIARHTLNGGKCADELTLLWSMA